MQIIRMSVEQENGEGVAVTIRTSDANSLSPYFVALRATAVAMTFHSDTVDEHMAEKVGESDFAFSLDNPE